MSNDCKVISDTDRAEQAIIALHFRVISYYSKHGKLPPSVELYNMTIQEWKRSVIDLVQESDDEMRHRVCALMDDCIEGGYNNG